MVKRDLPVLVALTLALGCKPELSGRASLVDGNRILAVQSTPAELQPGEDAPKVSYRALFVAPDAAPDPAVLRWSFCDVAKPLAVTGPVAPECLASRGPALSSIGNTAEATVPVDACRVFGSTPPEVKAGEPVTRSPDPDTTGGYYQPVRVTMVDDPDAVPTVGVTRLACGLGSTATQEQAIDFAKRYRPNENPALSGLGARRGAGAEEPVAPDAPTPVRARPGETLTLRAHWAPCPTEPSCGDGICGAGEDRATCPDDCVKPDPCTGDDCSKPHGCTGSEPYVVLDPIVHRIVARREAMRVSWFATAGEFAHDRTGRSEEEAATTDTDNDWTAPASPGDVQLWAVIRDDRGGVGFSAFTIDVGP